MKKLVVRHHNPFRLAFAFAGLVILAIAAGWWLFQQGRDRSGLDFEALREEARVLREQNEQLHATINGLREKQALAERGQQIEREAYKLLEGTVLGLQGEISELKSELAFYRSIVTPANSTGGLHVQALDIESNGLERGFRYKLVLTQILKNDRFVSGRADVAIEGSQGGRIAVLNLAQLDPTKSDFDFKFKYFQNFEGNFQLPAGFMPQRVTVKVNPRDGRNPLEKVFNWPA